MFLNSGLHIDQAPPLHLPLRFFATAPLFLGGAGIAVALWGTDLLAFPLMPRTIATAHLIVLGWLAMVMTGAMYQMIPVLAGIRVPWLGAAHGVHALLTVGVLAMVVELGWELSPWLLLLAAACLAIGVGLFVGPVALALFRAPADHPTVAAMRLALAALTATLALGLLFLGEHAHGFLPLDRQAMVGVHLTWGILGWVGVLIVGVSFQVLPMFYMMPLFPTREAGWILTGLGLSLLAIPVALLGATDQPAWLWLAAAPGVAGLIVYGRTVWSLIRRRQRKRVDPTLRFWFIGLGSGGAGLVTLALWPAWEADSLRYLFGVLFLMGGAGGIVVGMLYKIVPFLVWFHRFSRLAGLAEIPMMDDLVPERVARHHPLLHGVVVVLLAAGSVTGWAPLLWAGGAGVFTSALMVGYAIHFALDHQPPPMPEVPDFASFFKDFEPPA